MVKLQPIPHHGCVAHQEGHVAGGGGVEKRWPGGGEPGGQLGGGADGAVGAQGHIAAGSRHIERLQLQAVARRPGQDSGEVRLGIEHRGQAGDERGDGGISGHGVIDREAVQGNGQDIARRRREVGQGLREGAVHKEVHAAQRQVGGGGGEARADHRPGRSGPCRWSACSSQPCRGGQRARRAARPPAGPGRD